MLNGRLIAIKELAKKINGEKSLKLCSIKTGIELREYLSSYVSKDYMEYYFVRYDKNFISETRETLLVELFNLNPSFYKKMDCFDDLETINMWDEDTYF